MRCFGPLRWRICIFGERFQVGELMKVQLEPETTLTWTVHADSMSSFVC